MLLQSVLLGKAREIYTQLSVEQASDYDTVKELILKGYELVPEAYRQKFRICEKEGSQTYVEFARIKEQLFDRWCNSLKVDKCYEKLRQLVLVEEFKRCVHSDVRTFINEQKAETLANAARLADDYSLTHKASFVGKPYQSFKFSSQGPAAPHPGVRSSGPSGFSARSNPPPKQSSSNTSLQTGSSPPSSKPLAQKKPFTSVICNYCKKEGHVLSDCFKLKRKQQSTNEHKPTGLITSSSPAARPNSAVRQTYPDITPLPDESTVRKVGSPPHKPVMEIFEPFIHDGFVSPPGDLSTATPVKILRDTGASQSLLLASALPFSDESCTGTRVLITGVDSPDYTSVPLHNVHLLSKLVSGPVTVGIKSSLPFDGVHLLLGNDLAGDKVVVNVNPKLVKSHALTRILIKSKGRFLTCTQRVQLLVL